MTLLAFFLIRIVPGDAIETMAGERGIDPARHAIELALCAILFALIVGIPAGMLAAVRRNSVFDQGLMGVSLTGYSMPIFWWGLLLILLLSVQFGWTPVSGRIAVRYDIEPMTGFLTIDALLRGDKGAFGSAVSHLILPTIVLGTNPLAIIARMTRSAMLEVLGEDYIRTPLQGPV